MIETKVNLFRLEIGARQRPVFLVDHITKLQTSNVIFFLRLCRSTKMFYDVSFKTLLFEYQSKQKTNKLNDVVIKFVRILKLISKLSYVTHLR